MHDDRFDAITRSLGLKISRRQLLGGTAATAGVLFLNKRGFAQNSPSEAEQLIEQFYQAIDAYQYDDAYALLGADLQKEQTAQEFEQGYSDTAFVQMVSDGVTAGANGTEEVAVTLTSWKNDGTISAFSGTYTVGEVSGELRILAADIAEADPPSNLPPLCAIDQLSFEIGPWDAGAGGRSSTVVATNTSNDTCVLGGSPRLILTAKNGDQMVSTSEAGSPPVAITVEPSAEAQASIHFSNWCESDDLSGVTLGVEIAGDDGEGTVDFAENGISFPPCLGEGQAAAMGVMGWVAASD